jgi:hypothetical protein
MIWSAAQHSTASPFADVPHYLLVFVIRFRISMPSKDDSHAQHALDDKLEVITHWTWKMEE